MEDNRQITAKLHSQRTSFRYSQAPERRRAEYREGVVLLRIARSSGRRTEGTQAGGGEAGMERRTAEEVGRDELEVEGSSEAGRSKFA